MQVNLEGLYTLADKYNMQMVLDAARTFLMRAELSTSCQMPGCCLKWLAFGYRYNLSDVHDRCLQFACSNATSMPELQHTSPGGVIMDEIEKSSLAKLLAAVVSDKAQQECRLQHVLGIMTAEGLAVDEVHSRVNIASFDRWMRIPEPLQRPREGSVYQPVQRSNSLPNSLRQLLMVPVQAPGKLLKGISRKLSENVSMHIPEEGLFRESSDHGDEELPSNAATTAGPQPRFEAAHRDADALFDEWKFEHGWGAHPPGM